MVMRRRVTEILTDYTIGTSGEVKTVDLPNDFSVGTIAVTFRGLEASGTAATRAEALANLTTLELTTRSGSPIKIVGRDLAELNRTMYGVPTVITHEAIATDNLPVWITYIYPLNPTGVWNGMMGINPTELGKLRLTLGTDTATAMDGRSVTVTCIGVEGVAPATYMAMFQDSFTSVVGDNFRDIQQEKVVGMTGIYAVATTSKEDLGASSYAEGIVSMGYAISQSIKEKMITGVMWQLMQHSTHKVQDNTTDDYTADGDYMFFDLGMREGSFIPYVDKLQVYIKSGVAEAMKVYPMLIVRN